MNPAPTTHPQPATRPRQPPAGNRRIPSGLEVGVAFALGTVAPAHYASFLLAATATVLLYRSGSLLTRWFALPPAAVPPVGRTAWLCVVFCLGWLNTAGEPGFRDRAAKPQTNDARGRSKKPVAGTVRGIVTTPPVLRQTVFSHQAEKLKYVDFKMEASGSGRIFHVKAEISGSNLPAGLKPGVLVVAQGKIYPLPPTQVGSWRKPAATIIRTLPGGLTIQPGPGPSPGPGLRWRVLELINRMYSGREQGLFCALIAGEKRLLDKELRLHFIETGTAHFLAISGLHVGLVMLLAMRIPFPGRVKTALRLLVLGVFVLLSGANTPVLRAALMIALHLLLRAAGRLPKALDTLGWTLLTLLYLEPASIRDPGFQLSFVATTAILASISIRAGEAREKNLLLIPSKPAGRLPALTLSVIGAIRSCLWISLVSTAATAPLIATYFGRFHPLAPLLSVCLYPLVALSLILGLASVLLGFLWLEIGCIAAEAAAFFARLLEEFLAFSRTIPGHCLYLPAPGFTLTLVFYLLMGAGLSRPTRTPALLVSILILPIVLILNIAPIERGNLRLTHIDTRAGSAALLEIPSSKSIFLLDACGSTPEASRHLLNTLLRAGHRRIDGIFLTHPHADHAGALPLLSKALDVGEIFCSTHFERDEQGKKLLEAAREEGVPITKVKRGDLLKLPGPQEITLRILYPDREEPLALSRRANDMSLAILIESGGRRIICLGDLEESGLARLFSTGEELGSEVLVLPHHGRSNKLYDALLERVRPGTVVVSGDGRGGAEATLQRIEQSGIRAYSTWRGGGILNEWTCDGIRTVYLGP